MKQILTVTALALATLTAFGQGSVTFSNSGGTQIRLLTATFLGPVPVGSAFKAALYWAPETTPDANFDFVAQQLGAPANFGPVAGYFSGGGRTITSLQPPGGNAKFQIRVWESAYGNSFEEAWARGFCTALGKSMPFIVDTANPLIGEPNASMGPLIPGFVVYECPEPSVIGLGLLGAGALLLLRRRK